MVMDRMTKRLIDIAQGKVAEDPDTAPEWTKSVVVQAEVLRVQAEMLAALNTMPERFAEQLAKAIVATRPKRNGGVISIPFRWILGALVALGALLWGIIERATK